MDTETALLMRLADANRSCQHMNRVVRFCRELVTSLSEPMEVDTESQASALPIDQPNVRSAIALTLRSCEE